MTSKKHFKGMHSNSSFFLRFVLGLISSSGLGLWLCCIADLPEAMYESNSPMVGIAPFLNVFFIFIFAWLTYAFLGASYNCKRFSEGKLPVRWEWPAFWFALVISSVAALYFICAFYLTPCPEPEFIGLIH